MSVPKKETFKQFLHDDWIIDGIDFTNDVVRCVRQWTQKQQRKTRKTLKNLKYPQLLDGEQHFKNKLEFLDEFMEDLE